MPNKKKTKDELLAENRMLKSSYWVVYLSNVLNNLIKWSALVLLGIYCGRPAIEALAGKETEANIAIKILGNLSIREGISYAAAAGFGAYGMYQRRLRRKTIERQHDRVAKLERQHDPKRSSSRLTKRGETNPNDKD
ncbi:MAG TPA: hypothetical protein VNQ79_05380 [Blastocatellia bacterium]|nr:hypothetical protein [Blastocatellia bacterium]